MWTGSGEKLEQGLNSPHCEGSLFHQLCKFWAPLAVPPLTLPLNRSQLIPQESRAFVLCFCTPLWLPGYCRHL